jgi:hypothetical protein
MHLLAFDTSTDALSVAVLRGTPAGQRYWQHQGAGGAAGVPCHRAYADWDSRSDATSCTLRVSGGQRFTCRP